MSSFRIPLTRIGLADALLPDSVLLWDVGAAHHTSISAKGPWGDLGVKGDSGLSSAASAPAKKDLPGEDGTKGIR